MTKKENKLTFTHIACKTDAIIFCTFALPVVNLFFVIDPQTGQLGEHVDHLERLQVVDENVWHPKIVNQLEVH